MSEILTSGAQFALTRWRLNFRRRADLDAWQHKQLARYLDQVLPRAPRYRDCRGQPLAALPIMDKEIMMGDFAGGNTRGITLEEALSVAMQAEQCRDFSPLLGDLTVGLSSGTSGSRGVFLVSPDERFRWAGSLLARTLPPHLLRRLLTPWQPRIRIAFFLRANSNLYTTLSSRRIDFRFHDLLTGLDAALPQLLAAPPDVLVAPASVLRALAMAVEQGGLSIRPSHIISVAEVLEAEDAEVISRAFGVTPIHQIYQATEGFLGYTCEHGSLHLNEAFVHFEKEWLDAEHTRFHPIITDFSRDTQLIVRYRLNDILRVEERPCPCGRADQAIAAVEGRADEVLWLAGENGKPIAIFPDLLRRTMALAGQEIAEYRLIQNELEWEVALKVLRDEATAQSRVRQELDQLWRTLGVRSPELRFSAWQAAPPGEKRRRIRCLGTPQGWSCGF